MTDCIFCKVLKGEIPSAKIYENDKILAFLDINPVNPGHTLVVPKKHIKNMEDVPDDLLSELIIAVKKITKAIKEALGTDSVNLGLNNGILAGQLVPHVHFHIMPRFEKDGYKHWEGKPYKKGQMEQVQKSITKYIKE
jgi:histidine triad (HIT) family protein